MVHNSQASTYAREVTVVIGTDRQGSKSALVAAELVAQLTSDPTVRVNLVDLAKLPKSVFKSDYFAKNDSGGNKFLLWLSVYFIFHHSNKLRSMGSENLKELLSIKPEWASDAIKFLMDEFKNYRHLLCVPRIWHFCGTRSESSATAVEPEAAPHYGVSR